VEGDKVMERLLRYFPDQKAAQKWVQSLLMILGENQALFKPEVDRQSLLRAVGYAAMSGLSVDPALGHMYFVPRRKGQQQHISFQVGYRGLLKLAYDAGKAVSVSAEVVYGGDEFEYSLGSIPLLRHVPKGTTTDIVGAWASMRFRDGTVTFAVCTPTELQKRRQASAGGFGWQNWPEEMSKKTVLRKLLKLQDLGERVQAVIGVEEGEEADVLLGQARPSSTADKVMQRLAIKPSQEEVAAVAPGQADLSLDDAVIPAEG